MPKSEGAARPSHLTGEVPGRRERIQPLEAVVTSSRDHTAEGFPEVAKPGGAGNWTRGSWVPQRRRRGRARGRALSSEAAIGRLWCGSGGGAGAWNCNLVQVSPGF